MSRLTIHSGRTRFATRLGSSVGPTWSNHAAFEALIADPASDLTPAQAASLEQIAGELERRLGFFDKASRRFATLLDAPGLMGSELEQLVHQEIALVEARDSATHPIETKDSPRP